MSKELSQEMRDELKKAGEPVGETAEMYALGRIRNMPRSPEWAEMRVGVTAKSVYVAPSQRGGGRRKNKKYAPLMLRKSMEPALEKNEAKVVKALDDMLDRMAGRNGF